MSDFIREVDEEYRQDQFRRFLSRYWAALLLLVVVILAAVGGWRAYQYHIQQQAEAAGARYFDAVDLGGADPKASLAGLDALAKDGPAGYRTLAADGSVPQEMRDIAALRAGILLVDSADPAELRRRLEPLADANSAFRSVARELLAAAAMKRGDGAAARPYLDAILKDPLASPDSRQRAGFFLAVLDADRPAAAQASAQPAAEAPEPAAKPEAGDQPAAKP